MPSAIYELPRRTNVGEDKDSDKRQRAAILAGARRIGCEITDWFYDAGVSGDVEVSERLGFTANRFSRNAHLVASREVNTKSVGSVPHCEQRNCS
jgi:hypothetical protein